MQVMFYEKMKVTEESTKNIRLFFPDLNAQVCLIQ